MKANRSKLVLWILIVTLLVTSLAGCKPATPDEIRVGGLFDLTGATSEVCVPYVEGVRDYVTYINERGGINGRHVVLTDMDYGYNIERAKEAYRQLVEDFQSMVIMGWGTGDTEAMRSLIAADELPFMSASYAELLTNPQEAPYNFLIGVTYSDQMRIAMQYILDTWTDTSRPPRVALIYNDTLFGLSPIQDGRDYAAARGLEIVDEEIVSLSAEDVTPQLQAMAAANPDYAIVQETTASGALIVSTAYEMELPTKFIMLNWSADEKFIALTGEAGGVLGTVPFSSMKTPRPAAIRDFNEARR
jgi:branched-chain amino acid transport system substrate-binding protein